MLEADNALRESLRPTHRSGGLFERCDRLVVVHRPVMAGSNTRCDLGKIAVRSLAEHIVMSNEKIHGPWEERLRKRAKNDHSLRQRAASELRSVVIGACCILAVMILLLLTTDH